MTSPSEHGGEGRENVRMTTNPPPEVVATIADALAIYDETMKSCPVNNPKPGARHSPQCTQCRATAREACSLNVNASYLFIKVARTAIALALPTQEQAA